jgi:hypothetical protein
MRWRNKVGIKLKFQLQAQKMKYLLIQIRAHTADICDLRLQVFLQANGPDGIITERDGLVAGQLIEGALRTQQPPTSGCSGPIKLDT